MIKKESNFDPTELNVLVIDDHPQMRKAIVRVLAALEFRHIIEVGTGSEAIRTLSDEPIDLVICDLFLLDVSGFDVLEYIRNRAVDSDIPVIVVTGEASKEDIVKAADLGANDYLLKPFKVEDLSQKIVKLASIYQNPPQVVKIRRRAERLFREKKYDEATNLIQDCLKIDGDSLNVRHLWALTLDKQGQTESAIGILQKNIELNDSFYKTHAALADIYLRLGRKHDAIEAILNELDLNPKQTRRQTQAGMLLLATGRLEEAIHHFREALKESVKYKNALFGMGQAYATIDNIDKAIYYFRRVRRYYPTNTRALEAIVKVCLDAGDARKAEFVLRDEKSANKNRIDTYIVLSKLYLATNEQDKAKATLNELLVLKPDNIQGQKLMAAIHMRYNEFQAAIDIYTALLSQEPDADTCVQLADVYFKCKRLLDAITTLHRTVRLSKSNHHRVKARLATAYAQTNQSLKSHLVFMTISSQQSIHPKLLEAARHAQKSWKLRRIRANKPVAS